MAGAQLHGNDSTFLKLQRLVAAVRSMNCGGAAPRDLASEASQLATDLGAKSIPVLCRLLAQKGSQATRAGELLCQLSSDPDLRDRVVCSLRSVEYSGRDAARAVVDLLAQLAGPSESTDSPAPGAVGELVKLLEDAQDYARVASELCELTDETECVTFVADIARSDPHTGCTLAHELLARDQFSDRARDELRRIASAVPPSCRVRYGSRRPRVRLGRCLSGRRVLLVTQRQVHKRWRVLFVVINSDDVVVAAEYSDDATRHTLDKNIIGSAVAAGYEFEKIGSNDGRELLVSAIRATRRAGLDVPTAYFDGRDLLDITDEHRRTEVVDIDNAALLASALDALSAGDLTRALSLFESYTTFVPHDPEGFEGLGLCQMRLGHLHPARSALGRAAFLQPEEPRYHWNRAAAAHSAGLSGACYLALRDYLRVVGRRDAPERIHEAQATVASFERRAALYFPDLSTRSAACQTDLSSIERQAQARRN